MENYTKRKLWFRVECKANEPRSFHSPAGSLESIQFNCKYFLHISVISPLPQYMLAAIRRRENQWVGGTKFYFPSWKMIYSGSLTQFYIFMRSKTKFYRSKKDMMDKVLHFQRQMNNVLLAFCLSRTKFYLNWVMLDIVL